jgi:aminoglycoside phosphotransferase (APT) family kinase protein
MSGLIVTRYPDSTVVKKGRRVNLDERPALELAAEYGLPVPRVYDAGAGPILGEAWIQMDFIHGEKLDLVWPGMTAAEKSSICRQLRDILTTMRSIPSETGLIGSCSGGEARDIRIYTDYRGGPFANEEIFNSAFYFDISSLTPIPIRTALYQQIRHDHRIVFSHGDIAQHNILVKDGQITALLDWETAGWFPEHWDYIKFFDRKGINRDWQNYAPEIFPQSYDTELAYHQAIVRWQHP